MTGTHIIAEATSHEASPSAVRNSLGWRHHLDRLRGSRVQLDLQAYDAPLAAINALEADLQQLSDDALQQRSSRLIAEARSSAAHQDLATHRDSAAHRDSVAHKDTDASKIEAFALAREAARRTLSMRPYDVQVVAGLAMVDNNVVEMQTGEGKTLAALLPAYFLALGGRGVHILTFNDYLAERDAHWMSPAFEALGMQVGFVCDGMDTAARRHAYAADVTYVTAKEAGFDQLRDMLATTPEAWVHRPLHVALVDEADSLLIDEARIPLVIAGRVDGGNVSVRRLAETVRQLEARLHYDTDDYQRNVELTEDGFDRAEELLGCGNLLDSDNYHLLTELNCALHAHVLLHRDADYIVRQGRLELVDEHTGRVVDDRHWPDGLQAALEAKEGLERSGEGRILGSITLQHYLKGYSKLSGMTGTAQDAAQEIWQLYRLGVVVLPTHRPMIRIDAPDLIFTHRQAKEQALVEEIRRSHHAGRPVLVGTATVETSERLAQQLRDLGLSCEVLNAKNDAHEAEIIAQAGQLGALTIATNMAGRGTDICLGEGVAELGGLYVLGTEHHESQRVDRQLRGRAGRQGDPGASRFFVSLEDDLLVRYGLRHLIPPALMPTQRSEPIDNPLISSEIARAQRIIEGQNLEIRKTLFKYAEPIEEQRQRLQDWRRQLVFEPSTIQLWAQHRSEDYARLVEAVGADVVHRAEQSITLHHIDAVWSDHLAFVADLREGNHLVGLGGEDPLTRFHLQTAESFHTLRPSIEEKVLAALPRLDPSGDHLHSEDLDVRGPSATWTYLINDDPFRDQLSMMLTGPGKSSMAIGAAMVAPLFLILWGLADKYLRKRRRS